MALSSHLQLITYQGPPIRLQTGSTPPFFAYLRSTHQGGCFGAKKMKIDRGNPKLEHGQRLVNNQTCLNKEKYDTTKSSRISNLKTPIFWKCQRVGQIWSQIKKLIFLKIHVAADSLYLTLLGHIYHIYVYLRVNTPVPGTLYLTLRHVFTCSHASYVKRIIRVCLELYITIID